MHKDRILHIPIAKKWFDMIDMDIKKEEYRAYKPHWISRLVDEGGYYREYDIVRFTNGYGWGKPSIDVEFKYAYAASYGIAEWGAQNDGEKFFIIHLGKVLKRRNLKEGQ